MEEQWDVRTRHGHGDMSNLFKLERTLDHDLRLALQLLAHLVGIVAEQVES